MSAIFTSWPFLWAQANAGNAANPANNPVAAFSPRAIVMLMWLFLASDPSVGTRDSLVGGILIWVKAVSLICLVCWVVSWLIIGVKERIVGQGHWFDYVGLAGLILTPVAVMLKVLEDAKRLPPYRIGGYSLTAVAAILCVLCFVIWAEIATALDDPANWPAIGWRGPCRRAPGSGAGRGDRVVSVLQRADGIAGAS